MWIGGRKCASLDGDLITSGELTEDERRIKPGITPGFYLP